MVGQDVGVGAMPWSVVVRCRHTAEIRAMRLKVAWATRSLIVCFKEADALLIFVHQMLTKCDGKQYCNT